MGRFVTPSSARSAISMGTLSHEERERVAAHHRRRSHAGRGMQRRRPICTLRYAVASHANASDRSLRPPCAHHCTHSIGVTPLWAAAVHARIMASGRLEVNLLQGVGLRDTKTFGE